jgi:hypothetical protein
MTRAPKPKRPGPAPLSGKHGVRAPVVQVKLTPEQAARWRAAAERQGQALSAWLREAGDLAVTRGGTR